MKQLKNITDWKECINQVVCGDCLEGMNLIPDKSIQLIIFDPPYYKIKGDFDFTFESKNEWLELLETCAKEFKRILADNGSLYMFGHAKRIAYQQVIYDKYFNLENSLIWEKEQCQTKRGYETFRSYMPITERILFYDNEIELSDLESIEKEYIAPRNPFAKELKKARLKKGVSINQVAEYGKFYANVNHGGAVTNWEKGYNVPLKEQWEILCDNLPIERKEYEDLRKEYEDLRRAWSNEKRLTDVLKYPQEANITGKYKHPTQKPPKLIEDLIQCSSRKGDLILDPMMGSWVSARSAKDLGRNFIGFELQEKYCEIGEKRLEQLNLF